MRQVDINVEARNIMLRLIDYQKMGQDQRALTERIDIIHDELERYSDEDQKRIRQKIAEHVEFLEQINS